MKCETNPNNCPIEVTLSLIGGKYKPVILWFLIDHPLHYIQQGIHVALLGWGFIVDISNQRLIQQSFRFLPESVPAFGFSLGIGHNNRDKGENVRFTMEIDKGVVVHGTGKINGI